LARCRIQGELAVLQQRGCASAMTAQYGADARCELIEIERLDQIIVSAAVQTGDAIRDGIARSDDEYRRASPRRRRSRNQSSPLLRGSPRSSRTIA